MITLTWGAATHPGNRRSRNEDALLADGAVFAVADGMGGHAAGDEAALLAVEHLGGLAATPLLQRSQVLDGIRAADQAISGEGITRNCEMGTTLSGLALLRDHGERFVVFNVGDSRTYRLRDGTLTQLTRDHSVVQDLIDDGSIDATQAAHHPERHVVTRSLGTGNPLEIDWWNLEPRTGDRYLVTSDGLTKELEAAEIAELLSTREPQDCADRLVAAALANRGQDNVSVVVVWVTAAPDSTADPLDVDTTPRRNDQAPLDDDTTPVPQLAVASSVEATVVAEIAPHDEQAP